MPGYFGGVAQLGEHLPCKQGVMSSNLTISTKIVKRAAGGLASRDTGDKLVCRSVSSEDRERMFEEHP